MICTFSILIPSDHFRESIKPMGRRQDWRDMPDSVRHNLVSFRNKSRDLQGGNARLVCHCSSWRDCATSRKRVRENALNWRKHLSMKPESSTERDSLTRTDSTTSTALQRQTLCKVSIVMFLQGLEILSWIPTCNFSCFHNSKTHAISFQEIIQTCMQLLLLRHVPSSSIHANQKFQNAHLQPTSEQILPSNRYVLSSVLYGTVQLAGKANWNLVHGKTVHTHTHTSQNFVWCFRVDRFPSNSAAIDARTAASAAECILWDPVGTVARGCSPVCEYEEPSGRESLSQSYFVNFLAPWQILNANCQTLGATFPHCNDCLLHAGSRNSARVVHGRPGIFHCSASGVGSNKACLPETAVWSVRHSPRNWTLLFLDAFHRKCRSWICSTWPSR